MQRNKTVLIFAAIAIMSFVTGIFASPIKFGLIAPVSSGEQKTTPAPLTINSVNWIFDSSDSTLSGLIVNVTNIAPASASFTIIIQVSCATSLARSAISTVQQTFTCASGGLQTGLLAPGATATLVLFFGRTIDPELNQIEDISYIVTQTV